MADNAAPDALEHHAGIRWLMDTLGPEDALADYDYLADEYMVSLRWGRGRDRRAFRVTPDVVRARDIRRLVSGIWPKDSPLASCSEPPSPCSNLAPYCLGHYPRRRPCPTKQHQP